MLQYFFSLKSWLIWIQVCKGKSIDTEITGIQESHCLLPLHPWKVISIYGIKILWILRFAKNCTRENKDTTFDHKIAKFDTRENFHLYGTLFQVQTGNMVWYTFLVFYFPEPEEKLYTNSIRITHFIRLILIYHCTVYGGVTTKSWKHSI